MLALIRDGVFVERRDIALDDVPEHKRFLWRPIEFQGEGSEVETTIHEDRVVIRREPVPEVAAAPDDTLAMIAALVAKVDAQDAEIAKLRSSTSKISDALVSLAEEAKP